MKFCLTSFYTVWLSGGIFMIPLQQIFNIFPVSCSRSNTWSCRALQTLELFMDMQPTLTPLLSLQNFSLTFNGLQLWAWEGREQPVYLKHLDRDQIYALVLLCVHHVIFPLRRNVPGRMNIPWQGCERGRNKSFLGLWREDWETELSWGDCVTLSEQATVHQLKLISGSESGQGGSWGRNH